MRKSDGTLVKNERQGGEFGRPYNELLITLFNVFGLEPKDYQMDGKAGFGSYAYPERYGEFYKTKTKPLPHFYLG